MKSGNSVEDKTLTIRRGSDPLGRAVSASVWIPDLARLRASTSEGKSWTRGGSDRAAEPKQSGEGKGPEIEWGSRILKEIPRCQRIRVNRRPVQANGHRAAR